MTSTADTHRFVTRGDDGEFHRGDSVYRFVGTNMWYGPILASDGVGGNRERLTRELDRLQQFGITNVRILAGAEGPEGLPHHIAPVLQTAPGVYNDTLLQGLDRFIAELERRDMTAVIYLTNAWEWSGGYGSYLQWSGHGAAPVPDIDGYRQYVDHVSQFMLDDKARRMALKHADFMTSRTNSVTGRPYSESPAIMAWQIANEPRAFSYKGKEAMLKWIAEMARTIKTNDANHMVSTGSEGMYGCEGDIELWRRIHSLPDIDYAVIHLWPTNWQWAERDKADDQVRIACLNTDAYINDHLEAIAKTRKPIVIEEFGYPRKAMSLSHESDTKGRDHYYAHVMGHLLSTPGIAGVNFWGWNGEARNANTMWQPGDDYMCDPAHEPQGLYGVFDTDLSTLAVIADTTRKLKKIKSHTDNTVANVIFNR